MRPELRQLVEAIEAVEVGGTARSVGSIVGEPKPHLTSGQSSASSSQGSNARKMGMIANPTGWDEIDETLGGGLARAAIHEWFGEAWGYHANRSSAAAARSDRSSEKKMNSTHHVRGRWFPPLAIMIHLARQSLAHDCDSGASKLVVWIGRRCWPCHLALGRRSEVRSQRSEIRGQKSEVRDQKSDHPFVPSCHRAFVPLLDVSLFLDPPDEASRLWAIDVALRSPAVSVVVADGSNLQMAHTRRLQLAAEAGGTLGLFARPPWEVAMLSAARTRWAVSGQGTEALGIRHQALVPSASCLMPPSVTSFDVSTFRRFDVCPSPRWRIELLRCKGVRPASGPGRDDVHTRTRAWTLEYDRAESGVHLSADVADRSDPAAAA